MIRYKYPSLNTLAGVLESIEDPRDNRGKRHKLIDIFLLTIYGLLWGHTDFTNMVDELKYHESYFTDLLGLENGIPSHDTFSAVYGIINPAEFTECFLQWVVEQNRSMGRHVAIDGKAVRAACQKIHHGKVPILVNAFMVDTGICIGQLRVEAKTNEIKGIPDIMDYLDLKGAVVTTDAIGTHKEIVRLLQAKGADFVLPVKDNQSTLHSDIELHLKTSVACAEIEDQNAQKYAAKGLKTKTPTLDKLSTFVEIDKGHSRIERRAYYVLDDTSCIYPKEWTGISALGMVVRERLEIRKDAQAEIINSEPTLETETYILSKLMSAEEFACYARGHWRIENSLHWVLDDALREDRCTARRGHSTENLALMRKIVFNLLKLDASLVGRSVRNKQVYFRNRPDAVYRLIFEVVPQAKRD